jgi:hypothetical protein
MGQRERSFHHRGKGKPFGLCERKKLKNNDETRGPSLGAAAAKSNKANKIIGMQQIKI